MSVRVWNHPFHVLRRLVGTHSIRVTCHGGMSTAPVEEPIVIPKRIHRSHTDILKALSGTVGRDTTGPHYKYSDDPYLNPYSNLTKRAYALSKESGRKAARWIRQQNPDLFTHRPDEPFVEKYWPSRVYNGEGEESIGEDTLEHVITEGEVKNAVTVYNMCKEKGIELSDRTLQSLLELLCFYNAEEPLDSEWLEERWYLQTHTANRKTWKDNGLAEEVFAALTTRGQAAYCALIRGMSQYLQVDRSWQLYQECQERNIQLDTGTYNALIRVALYLRDASDLRWQLIKELLSAMANSGIEPNLGTLNATLEALSQFAAWRQAKDVSLQVLAEFHKLGIEPSLATYYHLLHIHCRDRGPRSHILFDILDHIENQSFTPQDSKDAFFFVTAMEVARNHLRSLEAAHRIHSFLHKDQNSLLIGDSYKESVYYRHYFALSCSSLPIDEFMAVYEHLVPHVYTPEPGIMQEVVQAVRVSGALHHLPKLWSDMIIFDHSSHDKLVSVMLCALSQHTPTADNTQLTGRLGTIAVDMWTRVQDQNPKRRNKVTWTGQMLGDLVEVLVRCDKYDTVKEVLHEATHAPHSVLGFLPAQALTTLMNEAVRRKDNHTAVAVVLYGQDAGHQETGQLALHMQSNLTLTPQQRSKVTTRLGGEIMTPAPRT